MTDDLPPDWELPEIGDILAPLEDKRRIHQGWSPQCEKDPSESDDVWGVLKTTAIQVGEYLPQHNKRLPDDLEPRPDMEVRAGDLLLTCAGPRSRCGVVCLVRKTRPKLMISGKMYRFRFDADHVLPEYVEAYLQSSSAWIALDRMKTGVNDSGLNLTQNRFRKLRVPLAPLLEQRQIVAAIEEHFARLEAVEAVLELAIRRIEVLRTAVLTDMIRTLSTASDCRVSALSDVLDHTIGGVWGKLPGEQEIDVDVVRVTELKLNGGLDVSTAARRSITERQLRTRRLQPGDLILEKSGGGPTTPVGRITQFGVHERDTICTNFMQLLRPNPEQVDSDYLHLVLHQRYVSGATAAMNKGSGNIRNIDTSAYLGQQLPIPPLVTQRQIAADLSKRLDTVARFEQAVERSLPRLSALRRAVLAQAFAGQLVPQDPDGETASVRSRRVFGEMGTHSPRKHSLA